jgi:hypothetical protein
MKNSSIAEIGAISTSPVVCSFRALSVEDRPSLRRFYLGLDFDERRRRFGGAVSDCSIAGHCGGIDWNQAIVLACFGAQDILSVVELHPISPAWDRAELALVCKAHGDSQTIVAHLLQIAAFAAGKAGCRELLLSRDGLAGDTLDILRGMGRVVTGPEHVTVDLGEYAKIQGYLLEADKRKAAR